MAAAQTGYSISRRRDDPYRYQVGFGNAFTSEAIPNVLPIGQNMPQKNKYELYTEGINGTTFTAPRAQNQQNKVYRIRPSVAHQGFVKREKQNPFLVAEFSLSDPTQSVTPARVAWSPDVLPANEKVNFIYGIKTMIGNGSPMLREGVVIHTYACNADMGKEAFVNSDGDFLIVSVQGRLDIQTELGKLLVFPGEIAVVQRGLKWKVTLPDGSATGYIQEIFGMHYELPDLGVIGSHGLANPRDFEHPVAHFDVDQTAWEVIYKLGGQLFTCNQDHTPFDIVAWHGNYVPYKYNLDSFISLGSLTRDHVDPSIWTVLTARSKTSGVALADFVFAGERWDVAEKTFRPPYFHRNTASEILGIISGDFGFVGDFKPGALLLETGFGPHGPNGDTYDAASNMELKPVKYLEGIRLAVFETSMLMTLTEYAAKGNRRRPGEGGKKGLEAKFLKHKDEIQADLKAAGLPPIPGL
ncbi:uncharacterized protein PHACADRAFT_251625 [Phanerochaete carnosa HHB-10118-sp]|uniref:homogentisate 1,2-dioxygenase n=1 Tax=Phanerochaete carnosa (strain HHB-10118-sp) TaxID=650164 RepID=K5X4M0_PHACS|nr:uncharacterized protein PHACADRAFT_251625 [Phanerochaete carnosa HHB-10118-sp]EKM57782.1 hypothetical protein PHACADRAFT_251625 [Phanerochaete carnosa HHB-10118-sp]